MESSERQNIVAMWLYWQFYEMPDFLLKVWKNYLLFAINFFSAPLLLKTLFSPWKRYKWRYPKGLDIAEIFSTFFSNVFSRIVGAVMRIFLILFGLIFQLFVLIAGFLIFLGWLLMPFAVFAGFFIALII